MKLRGEDRREPSSLNVFPFELKIAYDTPNTTVHFVLLRASSSAANLDKAVCTQGELPAVSCHQ